MWYFGHCQGHSNIWQQFHFYLYFIFYNFDKFAWFSFCIVIIYVTEVTVGKLLKKRFWTKIFIYYIVYILIFQYNTIFIEFISRFFFCQKGLLVTDFIMVDFLNFCCQSDLFHMINDVGYGSYIFRFFFLELNNIVICTITL